MINRRNLIFTGGALAVAGGAAYAGFGRMGSMDEYAMSVAETRAALDAAPDVRGLIRSATLAASSHNTQPWTFKVGSQAIDIAPDLNRCLPAVDPDNHHLFASLGCAAENLAIAAGASGRAGEVRFDPANGDVVTFDFGSSAGDGGRLFDAIAQRQSTRGLYDGRTLGATDLQTLANAAAIPGVDLVLITDRSEIGKVRDLVLSGNSTQMTDPAFVQELKTWMRFNPRHALKTGDGLFSATTGNPVLPDWIGPTLFDIAFTAEAENEKYATQIDSSAGIAVFAGELDDKEHWVRAGRASQRFALQATALGIKHAFINQPVEVLSLRPDLAAIAGFPGRRPDIVMRFGYGPAMPFSARRPVDAVLT